MPDTLERVRRFVSPITLLLGAVCFLLPFCAMSCNAGPVGASGDVVSASGLALVTGGDVSVNCGYLNQIGSAVNGAFGSTTGRTGATPSASSPCGSLGSSPSPRRVAPTATNERVGPFDGVGSTPTSVHVAVQPVAVVAAALLLLGALVALARGRSAALGGFVLAAAAAAALVVLRVTLTSSFNDDIKAGSSTSAQQPSITGLGGFDPTSVFQLTWGTGWWLSLVAAGIAATVSLVALGAGSGARGSPSAAGGAQPPWPAPGGGWSPPPPPAGGGWSPPPPPSGGGGGEGGPPHGGWPPPA
ncbi:MAG TPA: hypothetical protein VFO60_11015 [Candidatus Dormibacteraeota bacterium]|nr:hypothetical protein [Candidatus Dormibacteraeota bacterium]